MCALTANFNTIEKRMKKKSRTEEEKNNKKQETMKRKCHIKYKEYCMM